MRAEIEDRNARNVRVMLPITIVLHLIGFWTGWKGPGPEATEATAAWLRMLAMLHTAMLGPVIALWVALWLDRPKQIRAWSADLFVFGYAVFGALVSANAQRARPNIDIFTITLLAGAFLIARARTAIPSALVGGAILSSAVIHYGTDPAFVRSMLANLCAMTVGSIVFSRLIYTSNVREIAARLSSERHRGELAALNASLETKVAEAVSEVVEQSKELEHLNAQLQARVEQRSRELSEALEQLARARPRTLTPGSVIDDRVRIVRFVAEGGMGAVYEARDVLSDSRVAVKLVKASFGEQPEEMQRFLREARAGARIAHPAVARTLHVDLSSEGVLYQVQEFVDGSPLSRVLTARSMEAPDVAALGTTLARALEAAHAKGVVHRDIKPSNLMLTSVEPGLKVLDFGISKLATEERAAPLTQSSHILGTPEYMAPEQVLRPSNVDERCDVYLVGLVLYRMLAGRGPYDAETASQYLMAHAFETPKPLAALSPEARPSLVTVIERCLAKTPSDRPTITELASALDVERAGRASLDVSRTLLARIDPEESGVALASALEPSSDAAVTRDAAAARKAAHGD